MIEHFIFNKHAFPVYNVAYGKGIDLLSLANIINEVGPNHVPVQIIHEEMNNEYTSDNSRIMNTVEGLILTPHKIAISKMVDYFNSNLKQLDLDTVREDPFIKHCNTIWKEEK